MSSSDGARLLLDQAKALAYLARQRGFEPIACHHAVDPDGFDQWHIQVASNIDWHVTISPSGVVTGEFRTNMGHGSTHVEPMSYATLHAIEQALGYPNA